jgi:hypothetical protein
MTEPPQKLSSAEIVAEISRTRARLSRSLAVLDREYALRHLVVRMSRFVRHAETSAVAIGETVGPEVVPLTLIAIGFGWLGLAGKTADRGALQRVGSCIAALERIARHFGVLPPPEPEGKPVESEAAMTALSSVRGQAQPPR